MVKFRVEAALVVVTSLATTCLTMSYFLFQRAAPCQESSRGTLPPANASSTQGPSSIQRAGMESPQQGAASVRAGLEALRADFRRVWGKDVEIIGADPGGWRRSCSTPKLWLLHAGIMRTFERLKHNRAEFLTETAGWCFFEVAMTTETMQIAEGKRFGGYQPGELNWDVQRLLRSVQESVGGQLVWLVCRRKGGDRRRWSRVHQWGMWRLMRWAAATHGFQPEPESVVIRSRMDICFKNSFDLQSFHKLFRGPWGLNVTVGQQISSDNNLFTSFGSWENNFAAPLEVNSQEAILVAGMNMWARGTADWPPLHGLRWAGTAGPERWVLNKVFEGWNNHCLCRPSRENPCTAEYGGVPAAGKLRFVKTRPDLNLKCVFPALKVIAKMDPALRKKLGIPPTSELWEQHIEYFPHGAQTYCRNGTNLTETSNGTNLTETSLRAAEVLR